ncbi:BAHD acyltransferase BIA1-like [Humulus lupulus]|uniref:BAHD acyltransferase BIA1-like n=1 Tax=Humulus lupulus TaxID=3486 RepID=UPI002B4112EF|nr:BAHD acyltransferase BIA1-like [Humulus lupulus]
MNEDKQRIDRMETKAKVEITSRKFIKPSSPTSPQNKNLKLSIIDQIVPSVYTSVILFYSSNTNNSGDSFLGDHLERSKSNCLQKSLSETLVHFFPFAGQLNNNTSIECNDTGAYFLEAQINCQLVDALKQPDPILLSHLLPTTDPNTSELAKNVVLFVQLTSFNCGGIALSVCPSHKIADASSLSKFVKSWAAMAREHVVEEAPEFIGESMLPSPSKTLLIERITDTTAAESFASNRLVFDVSKLTNLKAQICSGANKIVPTNVELVSAIFLRCAINSCKSTSRCSRSSLMFQTVNLRKRMVPPIPESAIGNLISGFHVFVEEDSKMEVDEIVGKMRKGLVDFCNEKANRYKGEDGVSLFSEAVKLQGELVRMGMNLYCSSSWCKFPLYEVNFGWGEPAWITNPMYSMNALLLMDSKRGEGIEAWVSLDKEHMAVFEKNEELLSYASLNPSVILNGLNKSV